MPAGCFVILLPTESDYKILGYYFKEGVSSYEITNDLFLFRASTLLLQKHLYK